MIPDPHGLHRFDVFARTPRVAHAFASRAAFGGYDAARAEDRERLRRAVLEGARVVGTRQTHSATVRIVTATTSGPWDEDVDGLITDQPGVLLQAVSADCPLLLLAATDDSGAARSVGVVHCGWRGVARGIVDATLAGLADEFDVVPSAIVAAVSPGAGGCCYEVGDEVVTALGDAGVDVDACVAPCGNGRGTSGVAIDLKRAIRGLLEQAGVPAESIDVSTECSICGGAKFHSYRRDGAAAGRSTGAIGLIA